MSAPVATGIAALWAEFCATDDSALARWRELGCPEEQRMDREPTAEEDAAEREVAAAFTRWRLARGAGEPVPAPEWDRLAAAHDAALRAWREAGSPPAGHPALAELERVEALVAGSQEPEAASA